MYVCIYILNNKAKYLFSILKTYDEKNQNFNLYILQTSLVKDFGKEYNKGYSTLRNFKSITDVQKAYESI